MRGRVYEARKHNPVLAKQPQHKVTSVAFFYAYRKTAGGKMDSNASIIIEQVGNGFVVSSAPVGDYGRQVMNDDRVVFQSMQGLHFFLDGHFDHRSHKVTSDASPTDVLERMRLARTGADE